MSTQIDVSEQSGEQSKPFLRAGQYTLRVLSVEKKSSKKGNPMLVFQWELVSPESITTPVVDNDGVQVVDDFGVAKTSTRKIAGLQMMDWLVFGGDTGAVSRAKDKFKALLTALKMPMRIDIDDANQLKPFVGKAVSCYITTESGKLVDENTGTDMTDEKGNPITENNYRIKRFIKADEEHTVPSESVAF